MIYGNWHIVLMVRGWWIFSTTQRNTWDYLELGFFLILVIIQITISRGRLNKSFDK